MKNRITKKFLFECFDYAPHNGILRWKIRPRHHFKYGWSHGAWNKKYAGKIAGILNGNGYLYVGIDSVLYRVHRIIWFLYHGQWPNQSIDHINGDKTDNRISNLRDVSIGQNNMNCRLAKNNNIGITGICYRTSSSRYEVTISSGGERKYIGTYLDFFEACCARKSAEIRYGYHENHSR